MHPLICLCWETSVFFLSIRHFTRTYFLQALIQIDFIMRALWDNRNNFKTKQTQANEKRGTWIPQVDSFLYCSSFILHDKSVVNGNWKVRASVSFSHIAGFLQNLYVKWERETCYFMLPHQDLSFIMEIILSLIIGEISLLEWGY